MSDITRTAANVRPLPGAVVERFTAGGTVYVGDSIYTAADGDAEQAAAGTASGSVTTFSVGIAVSAPLGGTVIQPGDGFDAVTYGRVAGFSSMTPGDVLYQSDNAGRIADAAGTVSHKVGKARSATILFVNPALTEA